jgi:stage II sporulation protein D
VARRGVIGFLAALAIGLSAGAAHAATVVVVTGRGWGHGVGMSQWGARGYAEHGWRWQRILAHYYPGTKLGATPNATVRVLLAASQPTVDVGCAAGMSVSDATGRTWPIRARSYRLTAALHIPHRHLQGPLAFYCKGAPIVWDGSAYHGVLVVRSAGGRLSVVDAVDLEDYVRGVVGREMPFRWPIDALEAQAVAARSYALATLRPGRRFDLFADDRSQVYGGVGAETDRTLEATDQTAGRILTFDGHVATTYFFSTSGGRTADVRDVWPGLGAVPYLRSVADPYDGGSPVHEWGPFMLSAQVLAARLRVPFGAVRVTRSASGRVSEVALGSVRLTGERVRRMLGLRSTWFSLGELSLAGTSRTIVYGRKVALVARAQGVGTAVLQRRRGDGAWLTLKQVSGGERVTVQPTAYTIYRLAAGRVRGPEVGVAVAPRVRARPETAAMLAGEVLPRSAGAITVWRYGAGGWRVVAHPRLDRRGSFHAPLRLRAGAYRITVDADGGYAATSRTMHVTSRLLASLHR